MRPAALLIGLGIAACEQGRRVRYATTAAVVNELAEAADARQLSRVVGRYGRLDLLLLDELGEAIPLYERTLADRARILGEDHPDTMMSRNNLASAYQEAGRLSEAIAMHEQALADRARILGEDHPDTMMSRNNLASAYQEAGRLSEARPPAGGMP
jgi:DNA replication protein DnaC